jgi:hydrogenase-4 component B
MPWTGGSFLLGAMAIAGLPPLNGFASEWLTLQALVHVPAYGGVCDGIAGALALAALAATAALAVLCFVKVVGLVLLGPPRRAAAAVAAEVAAPMRAAVAALALVCVALGLAPALLFRHLVTLAPWPVAESSSLGLALRLPGTGSLPTLGIAVSLAVLTGTLAVLRGRRSAAPAPTWACGQRVEPALNWTSAGFSKPLRLTLEAVLRPESEVRVRSDNGVVQEVSYRGRVPHLLDERVYGPVVAVGLAAAGHARRLQSGRLGVYVSYLIALILVLLAAVKVGVIG